MRSNRRLIRKHRKLITRCAVRESKRLPIPIFWGKSKWMNYEIMRMGEKISKEFTKKEKD